MAEAIQPVVTDSPYLDRAMGKVSRSFAIVVSYLEEPLKRYLATAYLVCRVIDNVEDCFLPVDQKQTRFDDLRRMLKQPELAHEVLSAWEQSSWPGLSSDEQALMGRAGGLPLWQIYAALPPQTRSTIGQWAAEMIRGMDQLDRPGMAPVMVERNGLRLLKSERDYNDYCYFVAGTVGHLGIELVVDHYDVDPHAAKRLRDTCEACGRALQKTNIIKDFAEDHARGVSYIPDEWQSEADYAPLNLRGAPDSWKQKVVADVLQELQESVDHVLNVPPRAMGYRMASLLCLLPALHTIRLAAERRATLFTPKHQVKISRVTMLQILQSTQSLWHDDRAIVAHCQRLVDAIGKEMALPGFEPVI